MNTPRNTAVSLLLIGIADKGRHADAPEHAALEHCRKLALRCIEIFGGRAVGTNAAQIVAAFGSANTACRAAIVIREKTAALLPTDGSAPDIRIACLQGQEYFDRTADTLRTDTLAPIAAALMADSDAGHMRIDANMLNALSPDLQRHFQPSADRPNDALSANCHFYRYQPAESEAAAATTDIAVPDASARMLSVTRPEYVAQQASAGLPPHPRKSTSTPEASRMRLRLYHAGAHVTLGSEKLAFTIGRDKNCHLPIAGANISRLHAWIYADAGHFILRDQSTNGTFVKIDNMPEIHLRHQEIPLYDQGVIGIAGSTQDATIPQIEFQVS